MGNLQSALSRESQDILDAAVSGDVAWVKRQIVEEPKLIASSVTLVKRRGVLHLAAKQGHSDVISAVLEPLVEAVRQEFNAQQQPEQQPACSEEHKQSQGICEQQEQQQEADEQQQPADSEHQQEQLEQHSLPALADDPQQDQPPQQVQPHQPLEQQLVSFRRLRQTVNARDLYRRTPLIVAAKQGHLVCTQLLVEGAANLFAVDREGNTCLHYAALHGHSEVAEYLLQKARDRNLASRFANKRNLSGFTPLHYAVWGCSEPLVLSLLQAGADGSLVNDRVFDAWLTVPVGSTPLHLAVVRNHMPIALMLLQHYVVQLISGPPEAPRAQDPRSISNLYGMNPAQLAAHRGYRQMARVLTPTLSLARVLEALQPDAPRAYGPPSLKSIAAGVMQAKLTQELQQLEQIQTTRLQAAQLHDTAEDALPGIPGTPKELPGATPALEPGCSGACCGVACGSCSFCCDSPRCSRRGDASCCSDAAAAAAAAADKLVRAETADSASSTACCAAAGSCAVACEAAAGAAGMKACSSAAGCSGLSRAASSGWYEEQCCVCWEEDVSVAIGPCMHALCLACARQLVASSTRTGTTCPLCRSYIGEFGLLPTHKAGKFDVQLVSGAGI